MNPNWHRGLALKHEPCYACRQSFGPFHLDFDKASCFPFGCCSADFDLLNAFRRIAREILRRECLYPFLEWFLEYPGLTQVKGGTRRLPIGRGKRLLSGIYRTPMS